MQDHLKAVVKLDNIICKNFINKIIPFIDHKAKKDMEINTIWLLKDILTIKVKLNLEE